MSAIDEDDTDEGVVEPGQEVLAGYRVVELMSRGARIDTYDVRDQRRRCRCVVKIVRPDRAHEQRVRDGVLDEGRLLTTLTHPHLVRGYEVHEDPTPAVVLETLGGATLDALVDRRPLGVGDVVRLGQQVGSALAYLNDQGWLHLDVKPENVVVDRGRAVLIDLSVAARPGDGRPGAGTEEYLAPEQHSGLGLSAATDVWGWAMTLVEALTGDLPDPLDAAGPLPGCLPRTWRSPLGETPPRPLGALLGRCLAQRAGDRPAWDEILAELDRLV